jgi:hypothetical protein
MTRGYPSLRFDEANPSHHLYVNTGGRADGNYWVAYTLHFGGRKRRVRRSLGTKCLEEAIRLRDELFARIERDGEEVPERRRQTVETSDGEPEMRPVSGSIDPAPHTPFPRSPAMKKHQEFRYRHALISTADDTVTECERLTATPIGTSEQARRHWRRAAKLYTMAADRYRRAGLGICAIAAWEGAARCYETLGMNDDHVQCRRKAYGIPVYYQED